MTPLPTTLPVDDLRLWILPVSQRQYGFENLMKVCCGMEGRMKNMLLNLNKKKAKERRPVLSVLDSAGVHERKHGIHLY